MTRYHLLADTSEGETVEVDLDADDAAAAVARLAELVRHGHTPQHPPKSPQRRLLLVHAQPIDDAD